MSIPDVVRMGAVSVLYFATATFGLSLDAVSGVAAAVWLPTGMALAALVLYGLCLWPGIALAAFLVHLSVGAPLLVAGGMALGHTLAALLGAALLTRVVKFRPALDRLQDVLGLVVLAAGLSTLVSATIGVSSGWLGGVIPAATYGEAWRTWWLGDALGALVIAPLFFVWSGRGRVALSRRWIAEAIVLLGVVSVLSLAVFDVVAPTLLVPRYLLFPALICVALRLGPQGAVTALALVSASALWGTAQGFGPFAGPALHESLVVLQAFMSIVAVTILLLAAVIAERRQAEAAAHAQREQLHVTLSSIGDAVLATDSQGRVTFLNPVAAALTGWPQAEALGRDSTEVFDIVNEFTRQVVENPIARVIRAGTVVGLANHTLLIARDGVECPIDDSGAPIHDAQGRLLGVVLVFRDITARRQAERTREHLAAIVESSDDAIISTTLDGIITSWNRSAEQLYGYTAAEILGQPLTRLLPPDLADALPQIPERLRRGERIDHDETQHVAKDGTRRDILLTISPIRDGVSRIIGVSALARDITAQKQAEAEVERRQRETATLAELAQSLSASLDLDTVLQRVVAGAEDLCGSERVFITLREPGSDALVGRYEVGAPHMAYAGLRIEPGKGIGGQVLRTGRPWRTDDYATDPRFSKEYLTGARADGHLAVLAVPILLDGRVEGVLYGSNHVARPFTDRDEAILVRLATHAAIALHNAQLYRQAQAELAERRKAEAALQQAYITLEQRVQERTAALTAANEALHRAMAERQRLEREARRAEHFALLGRLAAGVSHELRNPLAAVFLHVDLVEEELRAPSPESHEEITQALTEIKTNLARVDDIVQDYLSLARVATLERTPQDLGAALQAWGTEWQGDAVAHGVTLQLHGLADLGTVSVHASSLRRAVLNLIQNALDAMPQGGTLTLTGEGSATQVRLQVRDTGSGIPPAQLPQIFEPLYTTKPGGTGLGLYLVREIVAAHGGQMTVQSVEGQGTTFTLTLPRTPEAAPSPPLPTS